MGPIKTLRSRSGDTLVEVMASIFIFLLIKHLYIREQTEKHVLIQSRQQLQMEQMHML